MATGIDKKVELIARIDRKLASSDSTGDAAAALRHHARDVLSGSEFPTRKHEDWKYTSVRPIVQRTFTEGGPAHSGVDISSFDAYAFSFVNGILVEEATDKPDGVFAGKLSAALADPEFSDQAGELIERIRKTEMGIFEALALGMNDDPFVVIVGAGVTLDRPLHLVYNQSDAGLTSYPYRIIAAGRSSAFEIVESYLADEDTGNCYTDTASRIFVAANAHVGHYRLQSEHYTSMHTANTSVVQDRDSTYGIYIAELGGKLVRHNVNVVHTDENITSNIYGLFIAQDDQHIDTQSFIDHAMPNCESNELFKGILLDRGRGVFNGKIIVRPDAQKINAYQQNAALVLSPDAVMDSKPQLEIFADDVRCSHGATIGQLDQDSLFYLKTRGLDEVAASALLKRAFLKDVIDHFPNENVAEYCREKMEDELARIARKSGK